MRHRSIGIAVALSLAAIGRAEAQAPWSTPGPAAAYPGAYQRYAFPGLTPTDAYRQHLINRWELEQLEGPTPQALQGPSPNGDQDFGK